jgi:hypothetical protein
MNKTFKAVRGAFSKELFPTREHIYAVSEPEACALFTAQDLIHKERHRQALVRVCFSLPPFTTMTDNLQGQAFILCDAGGGTVDIVSYRVDSISPLRLTRIGGIIGSSDCIRSIL